MSYTTPYQYLQGQPLPTEAGPNETLIYLVRHGQTAWNVERRFQGQSDVPLSEAGLQQADAVAEWFATQPVHFTALYSSDLSRAAMTAAAIGKRLNLEVVLAPELREIHVGEWQGYLSDEIEARYPGQMTKWRDEAHLFTMPGGESVRDVQKRVLAWYLDTVSRHPCEAIVIVSHGQAITTLLAALQGWDLAETELLQGLRHDNTGVSVVLADHEHAQSRTLLVNSLAHMPSAGAVPSLMATQNKGGAV